MTLTLTNKKIVKKILNNLPCKSMPLLTSIIPPLEIGRIIYFHSENV